MGVGPGHFALKQSREGLDVGFCDGDIFFREGAQGFGDFGEVGLGFFI